MNTITIYRASEFSRFGGAWFAAFDEEGQQITGHGCSDEAWAYLDLIDNICEGKAKAYAARYPNGYVIKDMIDSLHPSIKEATNA